MNMVGLTGGIGSGKTTVAYVFESLGISVYYADIEAKKIINNSNSVKKEIIDYFGKDIYTDGFLNKKLLADIVFSDKKNLEKLNSIVHPRVAFNFQQWALGQKGLYVIKEAAILFESGSYKDCDAIITVVAPLEIRINRIAKRDNISEKEIKNRIDSQYDDSYRLSKSDYVIENIDLKTLGENIQNIHRKLLKRFIQE